MKFDETVAEEDKYSSILRRCAVNDEKCWANNDVCIVICYCALIWYKKEALSCSIDLSSHEIKAKEFSAFLTVFKVSNLVKIITVYN